MTESARPSREKVFVLVAHPGKHLFRSVRANRVKLRPDERKPDLIVFPCSQDLGFIDAAAGLPAELWQRVRSGRAGIVFDASGEGRPHDAEQTSRLNAFLASVDVGPDRCVYLTQDRQYRADYEAHCATEALGPPMAVLTHDYWVRRFFWEHEGDGQAVFEARLAAFKARDRRRERRFVSLNLSARPSKVMLLLRLLRDGHWGQGFISFGGFELILGVKGRTMSDFVKDMRALEGFEDLVAELHPYMDQLAGFGGTMLGADAAGEMARPLGRLTMDAPLPEYGRSWFTIVTESEMSPRPSRITEKPLKPLANFHPLIVFGNPGALRLIREMGFVTFDGVIDESYDEEPDPRRRFDLAYREVERLCAMDETDLAALDTRISETLVFNAEQALVRLPTLCRDELDGKLIDEMLAAVGLT